MRWLKYGATTLGGIFVLLAVFFAWAGSPTLAEDEYASLRRYGATPADGSLDTLTVVSYNIGYLSGMANNQAVDRSAADYNRNLEAALYHLSSIQADVIAFQEIDFGGNRAYDVHQLDTLATRLDMHTGAQAVNWDKRYVPFPYGWPSQHYGRIVSGQGILSRLPLRRHERIVLERPPNPFWYDRFYIDRLVQVVDLASAQPLRLLNVHLEAFDKATRMRQAEALRQLILAYHAEGLPLIVLGDFNSIHPAARPNVAVHPEMGAWYEGDDTVDQLLDGTGLAEAFADSLHTTHPAATYTYSSAEPRVKIDHILYSTAHLRPVDVRVVATPEQPSDHLPVIARFTWVDARQP